MTHDGEAMSNSQRSLTVERVREITGGMTELLSQPRWYAVYTLPRHEKTVADLLQQKSIEYYLPLFEKASRWTDRVARLRLPLFPGYVFVRIPLIAKLPVLEVSGVVRIVGFSGQPAPLPEGEIESLRTYLTLRNAEPFPFLSVGKRVRVNAGPLAGLEGVIVRRKGRMRIVVSIDSIQRSIALELEAADVRLTA